MGLEGVIGVIERECAARLGEIEARRSEDVEAVLAEARGRGERIRQGALDEVVEPAERERRSDLHAARLDAFRIVGQARADALDRVLGLVRRRLEDVRGAPGFASLLERLARDALADLAGSLAPGEPARLSADARDRGLVERLVRALDPPPEVLYDLVSLGGVTAESADGRIVVDNTLEARLESAWPALRAELVRTLEGG